MTVKGVLFLIWTLAVVFAVYSIINAFNSPDIYKGTTIDIPTTTKNLEIQSETVNFSAASADFFVLRKEDGEYVVSIPGTPPLGWNYKTYYVVESQEISGGDWSFASGSATIKITNQEPVTVIATDTTPGLNIFLFCMLGFCLWFLVLGVFL